MTITPRILLLMTEEVAERAPDTELRRNEMGNLAIMRGEDFIGWMDFNDGAVHWVEDES